MTTYTYVTADVLRRDGALILVAVRRETETSRFERRTRSGACGLVGQPAQTQLVTIGHSCSTNQAPSSLRGMGASLSLVQPVEKGNEQEEYSKVGGYILDESSSAVVGQFLSGLGCGASQPASARVTTARPRLKLTLGRVAVALSLAMR